MRSARHDRDRIQLVAEIFQKMMAAPPTEKERDMAAARPGLGRVRILRLLAADEELAISEPAPIRFSDIQDAMESR